MPRSEARVFVSIWDDEDFTDLSADGMLLYLFLLTQPTLGHSGVLAITLRRWSRKLGWTIDRLSVAIDELAGTQFIVVDEDTDEMLIRSLIRNDGIWKQPKMLALALTEGAAAASPAIRAAITAELRRLDVAALPANTRSAVKALLDALPDRLAHARPIPPRETHPNPPAHPPAEGPADAHAEGPRGRGEGNGRYHGEAPTPIPEPPPPAGGGPEPAGPSAANGVTAEGGRDSSNREIPDGDAAALVGEIRALRPDWSTKSIERAIADPGVTERPWPLVRSAAIAVARDPESQQPGRLARDGPWWHQAGQPRPVRDPPPWCGKCDERTRLRDLDDGTAARCNDCHPLTRKDRS